MATDRGPRPLDNIIRMPRRRDVPPTVRLKETLRRPRRLLGISSILVAAFVLLMTVGALLLTLPLASNSGESAPLEVAYFTAISAATVTGHTVVSTPDYWAPFGQIIIFLLMLVGGLGFMVISTFLLLILGDRTTIQQRALTRGLMSDAAGVRHMRAIRAFGRRVIILVVGIYLLGSAIYFSQIIGLEGIGTGKAYWYSLFLSVSSFNNAGFNIIPEVPQGNAARFVSNYTVIFTMTLMIALGGLGWVTMVDVWRQRRFARFSLDTKLVVITSLGLWFLGGAILAITEFGNPETLGPLGLLDKIVNAVFLSVSGRTAGFSTIDFGQVADLTKMSFASLMYIGGAPGSVAGGIKVVTFALIVSAVISSLRGRSHARGLRQGDTATAASSRPCRGGAGAGNYLCYRDGLGGNRERSALLPAHVRRSGRSGHGGGNHRHRARPEPGIPVHLHGGHVHRTSGPIGSGTGTGTKRGRSRSLPIRPRNRLE